MNRCNTRYKLLAASLFLFLFSTAPVRSQHYQPTVAVKSNLLYDATATVNVGAELRLGNNLSLDVPLNWNPWQFSDNRKWKHFMLQPEMRLWTRETFAGHFFGLHTHYAYYNIGNLPKPFSKNMQENRYQGWALGAGLSYGYRWNINHNWGLEATVGVGYAYLDYDKFPCHKCGEKLKSDTKHYLGPTKAGVSLIYAIGGKKEKAQQTAPVSLPPVVIETPVTEPEALVETPVVEREVVTQTIVVKERISTGDKLAQSYPYIVPYAAFTQSGSPTEFTAEEREQAIMVYFAQGRYALLENYAVNRQSLTDLMASIRILEKSIDSEVATVVIAGFASPEGNSQDNERLAARRADAVKAYILQRSGLSADQVRVHAGGIDWYGLRMLVEASDMPWRNAVLDIIDNTPVWDAQRQVGRHGELMRLERGNPYRYMLREFYPELRKTAYIKVYYKNK